MKVEATVNVNGYMAGATISSFYESKFEVYFRMNG